MILDANALIDFHWLNEWDWLKHYYSPLCVSQEVLDLEQLTEATKGSALTYLQPLTLDSEEMYITYNQFLREFDPIASADCSTLVIAKNKEFFCGTDDGKMLHICKKYSISYTRIFRLLEEMIETKHKSPQQVVEMIQILIEERGKLINPLFLDTWKRKILAYRLSKH